MQISASNITQTQARINFTGIAGAATDLALQFSIRPDFKFAIAPVHVIAGKPANATVPGLTPSTSYYVRARELINGVGQAWTDKIAFRTAEGPAPVLDPVSITHDKAMIVVPQPVVSWSADNTVAGYPVQNLGYDAPVGWRSKPAGNVHAFTAAIAPEPIDTIALLMSNVAIDATVTIKAANSAADAQGSPAFTHGPVPFRASERIYGRLGYHALVRLPGAQSYSHWRVEITSTLFGNLLELQHAIFGKNRATKFHAVDKTRTVVDLGNMTRTRSGGPQRALGWRLRREEFEIAAMREGEYQANYEDLDQRVGTTEPVLVVPNSKEGQYLHDRILYGTLGQGSRSSNLRGPLFTKSFSVDSIV